MSEIEQPVYLGEVAIQTPRQLGLSHFAGAHRHIECELSFRQRGKGYPFLGVFGSGRPRSRDVSPVFDISHEGSFNSIGGTGQSLFPVFAERMGFGNIGNVYQD
jgi:hypothetical protein